MSSSSPVLAFKCWDNSPQSGSYTSHYTYTPDPSRKIFSCKYCSKVYCGYSYEVSQMLKQVKTLQSKGAFNVVAEEIFIVKVEPRPVDPRIDQRQTVDRLWGIVMEDRVDKIGLYGVPGVGKSTLLSQINNEFLTREHDFDIVIWFGLCPYQDIDMYQRNVAKRLQLYDEEWEEKSQRDKAFDISLALKKMNYALLVYGMMPGMDVRKIGLFLPDHATIGSKFIFTTRHREVCNQLEVCHQEEILRLDDDSAMVLFGQQLGRRVTMSPDMAEVARKIVCERCWGIPLLINAAAKKMRFKGTVDEWEEAYNISVFSSVLLFEESRRLLRHYSYDELVLIPILECSYDNLADITVKRCFQYCALFPEICEISKDELVDNWEFEGLVTRNKAQNIFDKLVGTCLVMESQGNVKMHPMVRKMALLVEAYDTCPDEEWESTRWPWH